MPCILISCSMRGRHAPRAPGGVDGSGRLRLSAVRPRPRVIQYTYMYAKCFTSPIALLHTHMQSHTTHTCERMQLMQFTMRTTSHLL